MATARDPFDVTLTDEQKTTLAVWLQNEIDNAIAARSAQEAEVNYWHQVYEQARTRSPRVLPWPDAADLTSYIPCEKVDAIHARIMRTVWVNPVWTVEGYGRAADRAPFVEEFHQFKAEEERLQNVLDKVALTALIEPRCLLEVSESSARRLTRKTIHAKPQMTPEGSLVYGADGQPQLSMNPETGQYDEAGPEELGVQVIIDSSDVIRTGPSYRVLPYADSLIMPGHARDRDEITGYAKRIWVRLSDLKRQAKEKIYDREAVEKLSAVSDRDTTASLSRANQAVVPSDTAFAEKELWECLMLLDLNALFDSRNEEPLRGKAFDGARWYVVTLHQRTAVILRLQHDDLDRGRYINFILFPRPDRATEGYSFIGHKLITVTEEHTAYRNMGADAGSKAVNAPILKLQGALWDEDEQPMGPKAVITVRDPREIQFAQVPDVPASVFQNIERCERTAERLAGVNDIASGQVASESRTLGEIQMATEQSFVRMDLIVRRFQEAMEDLGQIRHAIWKRVLAEQPTGIDAPESLVVGLEGRGVPIDSYLPDRKITAALLDGPFRFKPYGSVETADLNKQRNNLVGFMQALPMILKVFPTAAQQMMMNPNAARFMLRWFLQVFRVPNPSAFVGSPSQDLLGAAPMAPPMMGLMGTGGMPGLGMSPGMPPLGMPPGGPPGLPPMMPGPPQPQ